MPEKPHSELLTILGHSITLIRSKRRTLSLEVGHYGVRVRAPNRMTKQSVINFVTAKHRWIEKQLANRNPPLDDFVLETGTLLPFNGVEICLQIIESRLPTCLNLVSEPKTISIPIQPSHLELAESVRRKLTLWYRDQANTQLYKLVKQQAQLMQPDRVIPTIKVRDYKRRWGSCNHKGELSFNWRLIMAPTAVQNYVVIHELAHREEFNHSKKFWLIVADYEPNWRDQQAWLQQNGQSLYRL